MASSISATGSSFGLSTLAGIEYAVGLKNATHVIVCGHLTCGIIRDWLKSPDVVHSNEHQAGFDCQARTLVREAYTDIHMAARFDVIVQEHTPLQVENLNSHEFIQACLNEGRLRLHAWVVDDNTARADAYEPESGQFRPLEMTSP